MHENTYLGRFRGQKILFVAQPWWVTFNTTALKLNFSDQNGDKEKCLENTLPLLLRSAFFRKSSLLKLGR